MTFLYILFAFFLGFYAIVKKRALPYILPLLLTLGFLNFYNPQEFFQELWKKFSNIFKYSDIKPSQYNNKEEKKELKQKKSQYKKNLQEKILLDYVLKNKGPNGLTHIYGDVKNSSYVVLALISPSCPVCHEIYGESLRALEKKASHKKSPLAFIKRFYPSDPLAFQLMTLCFSDQCVDTSKGLNTLDHGFSQWFQEDLSGEDIKMRGIVFLQNHNLLKSQLIKNEEKTKWEKILFSYYKQDKHQFCVKALPHFYIFIKQKNGSWTTESFHHQKVKDILEFFNHLLHKDIIIK